MDMLKLREALEASWQPDTAYLKVREEGNPALGQCYPTSRVVQYYFPETEIVEGQVWTGQKMEKHFWNVRQIGEDLYHIDLSWSQFPAGSVVKSFKVRDRETLGDGPETIKRVELLLSRVETNLALSGL
jgi:hypothetical protein